MRKEPEKGSAEAFGDMWGHQEEQESDFDYSRYDSVPWLVLKTVFAACMMALVYLLYALHELPWTMFGSVAGILILVSVPFLSGLILGFTFENPKLALAYSMLVGFLSIGICMFLMILPGLLNITEYGFGVNKNVWFYGFYIPFFVAISFLPAGTMMSVSTNVYD